MIQTKNDLKFYIAADRIMNGLSEEKSLKEILMGIINGPLKGTIINYLCAMRHYAYYSNNRKSKFSLNFFPMLYWHRRWNNLGLKLGFSIGHNSLGYGVVIPHHGTIVVNADARIGNYAVLHTCTCVAGGNKEIGDFFYLSTGSQIVGELTLGDGVTVAAHSLVNSSFPSKVLIAGSPATIKREKYVIWPIRDGQTYIHRMEEVELLKQRFL